MTPHEPPAWFWIVAGLLLVWNLMGLAAFGYDGLMTEEAMAALPPEHAALYRARPTWVVVAFFLAVTAGTAGSVALLMLRPVAGTLFAVSLVSVILQDSWYFLGGAGVMVMPVLVVGSLIGGLWLARAARERDWMRA